MFTSRTDWQLNANQLAASLNELRKKGAKIFDLTESNPTRSQFQYLKNPKLLGPLANPKNLTYEPNPKGMLTARLAIQNYYKEKGIAIANERLFLTASTSEAYSLLFRLLVNPGERVLIPEPSYPLFNFLADLNDVELTPYRLQYDGGWRIDLKHLAHQCTANTKAIILVHPNNPTGSFLKKNELEEIVRIAKDKSLALISDRSEERRVGKECTSWCRSRWSPYH